MICKEVIDKKKTLIVKLNEETDNFEFKWNLNTFIFSRRLETVYGT